MRATKATGRTKVGTKEAAALLGCSEQRVRRMIRGGELPAEKVRGRFGMEYQIERARLPGGARSAAAREKQKAAAEADAVRLREERDRWQQLWGAAQEEVGRLSAEAERARTLEARVDGLAQAEARARAEAERAKAVEARAEALAEAEARARAEMEAAQRRERETARQERESRDLVEQARRRLEEVGRQMEEVLRRAAGVAQEEAQAKAALATSRGEREQFAREVAQLQDRVRRWTTVTVVAVAVAVTAVVGLLVR